MLLSPRKFEDSKVVIRGRQTMHWPKVVIRSRQTMHWPNEKGQEDKQ